MIKPEQKACLLRLERQVSIQGRKDAELEKLARRHYEGLKRLEELRRRREEEHKLAA